MRAPDLDSMPRFDGATYQHARDHGRLASQLGEVLATVRNGAWWTLAALAFATGYPEASVSARLRDLRKAKFGGHIVERRYVSNGQFEYRLDLPRGLQLALALPEVAK